MHNGAAIVVGKGVSVTVEDESTDNVVTVGYRYSTTTVIKWAFKPKMSFKLLNTIETANTIFVEILIKFLLLLKFKISLLLKIT